MAAESALARKATTTLLASKCKGLHMDAYSYPLFPLHSTVRASHSMDQDKNKVYKQLGLFALKRKIEDAVVRAEILAPVALEIEEAIRNKQEEIIRDSNLWDDPAKSDEILSQLAHSSKVIDSLKDLTFKVEEAKLITQLAGTDAINYGLFNRAYKTSLHVSSVLDQYEMSKLLKGPFDAQGACVDIKASSRGHSEIWASQVLRMYIRWAEKQGYNARVVEKCHSQNGGIKSATIEFEHKFAYGFLSGERGVHSMTGSDSRHESDSQKCSSTVVDVVPMFIESALDLQIDDEDLIVEKIHGETQNSVYIQHIPTGVTARSAGESRPFANWMKALSRLKARLLVIAHEQRVLDVNEIDKHAIVDPCQKETRLYKTRPQKLVEDMRSGIRIPGLISVLDGNLEPLIAANINSRQSFDKL